MSSDMVPPNRNVYAAAPYIPANSFAYNSFPYNSLPFNYGGYYGNYAPFGLPRYKYTLSIHRRMIN